jgi:hypothetical protein
LKDELNGGADGWGKTDGPFRVIEILAGDFGVSRSTLRDD